MSRLAQVFALASRKGLNVSRGLEALAVLAVPFGCVIALDDEKYLLNVIFRGAVRDVSAIRAATLA